MRVVPFLFKKKEEEKQKIKVRWEPIGWRHVHQLVSAYIASSSSPTLLKMRDNPLSHASRFTAKLARVFQLKKKQKNKMM
jgi:hypothetical protein